MDNSFQLHPCDIYVSCHTYQCHNRASWFLGKKDAPRGTETIICDECANELIANVIKDFGPGVEVNADPLPFEPTKEELEKSVEAPKPRKRK